MKKPWKHRLKTGLLYLLVILLAVFAAVGIWAIKTQGEERTMDREWQISEEYDLLDAAGGAGLAEYRLEGRFPRHISPESSVHIQRKTAARPWAAVFCVWDRRTAKASARPVVRRKAD